MKYITLEDIKRQLVIDHDLDNSLLMQLGDAAEQTIENHIGQPVAAVLVGGQVPAPLKQAMLMFVASQYNVREHETLSSGGRISATWEALIGPYRKY